MIRTLQKKFTVTAMIAVTVLLVLLLGGIDLTYALSVSRDSDALLELLSAQEGFGPAPWLGLDSPSGADAPEDAEGQAGSPAPFGRGDDGFFRRSPNANDRMSALTFSVRFDASGELCRADVSRIADLSEEEAAALGREALESGKTEGRIGARKFRIVEPAPDAKTVVFLDLSRERQQLARICALSALGGIAAWGAMLILVRLLSKLAIRPVAENMQRQRQFITDAGHELKTPLAIIQANAEALELTGGESKYSRNIRAQVTRLSELTQSLLALAKADEAAAPDLQELDLTELCRETAESFLAPAEQKGQALSLDLPEPVQVKGDREQLRRLLSILLDNAVKYCSPEGQIRLTLRREGKALLQLQNSVSDRSADPERLFDRFYRADSSRDRQTGGFGIGLSVAKAIAAGHGGTIRAERDGEDRIRFIVTI